MSHERIELRVRNLDCENEAAAIQRGLKGTPGILEAKIYAKAAKVALKFEPSVVTRKDLEALLTKLGFPPATERLPGGSPTPWKNPKVLTSVASGFLLLTGWVLGKWGEPSALQTGIFLTAIVLGGYFFAKEAIEELFFEREIGVEFLMAFAAIVATVMGQALEGAMLVFLYSISEAAEGYTEAKTRSAVKALLKLAPKVARVRRESGDAEIPVEQLRVDDVFLVRPGQAIPTDGEVVAGESDVNQAPVTGESIPVPKKTGAQVFAGSINGEGALEVRTTKLFSENTLSRIIHMVEEAQERKGKSERFIERFGHRYSPAVLAAGLLLAGVPPLLFGGDWSTWILRATVFIVAAAPCALVISVPITMVATLGTGARKGVLTKGGIYVEELSKVVAIAFDKTGTLTAGKPTVTDFIVAKNAPLNGSEILAVASGIEGFSQHPLAHSIVEYARAKGVNPQSAKNFRSLTGAGAQAEVDGREIFVGSPDLFTKRHGLTLEGIHADIHKFQTEGKTVVLVGDSKAVYGYFALKDKLRPNAKEVIRNLRAAGIKKIAMLTGDNERTAQAIAKEAGIDVVFADLKPEDKVSRIKELEKTVGKVAMVGDGVNDAPALAEASVGIAMGAAGTDVALETADVALMADDLEKLVYAIKLARRTSHIVRQNLALSILVIGTCIVGAVTGLFSLPVAVLGHEISEFIVIGNGLRMLRA